MNFARQEDKAKDPKSHLYRQEENRKYDRVGALERTAASEGLYKSMQGAGLNLFMPAAIVAREDGIDSRKLARRREYVSAASALVRVMEPRVGSQSAQLSGDSRRASPERRPRAKSAVPHAGDKLNDALSRAWTDRQDSLRQSKAAAAVKQLLAEAKQVDSASTAAIAKAEQTIGKLYARSQRGSQRSPEDAGDKSCAPCASLPATEQDTPDELDSSMAAKTKQRGEEKRKRVSSARLSSPVNKTKELDGKARVWDISGGLHVAGASRGTPVAHFIYHDHDSPLTQGSLHFCGHCPCNFDRPLRILHTTTPWNQRVVVVWEHLPRAPFALSCRAEICSWRLVCRYAITLPRKQDEAPGLACPCLKHHAPSVCSSRSGPYLRCVARTRLRAVLEIFSDFPLVQCLVLRRRWRNQTGSCWKGTASIHYDIPRVPRRQRLTVERCVRTYTALAATGTLDSAIRSSTHSRPK